MARIMTKYLLMKRRAKSAIQRVKYVLRIAEMIYHHVPFSVVLESLKQEYNEAYMAKWYNNMDNNSLHKSTEIDLKGNVTMVWFEMEK